MAGNDVWLIVSFCIIGASGCATTDGITRDPSTLPTEIHITEHTTTGAVYSGHPTPLDGNAHSPETPAPGRKVAQSARWSLSDPKAVRDMEGTKFGEQEINEFWVRKGWRLTQREEHYLSLTDELLRQGKITPISRWAFTPFWPVYQTLDAVNILGVTMPRGHEFVMDANEDEDDIKVGTPRFGRANEYQEEHEGHVTQEATPR